MSEWQGLTIAICTRNRPDDLRRCVASIAGQSADYPLQVLIVDDGELSESELDELCHMLGGKVGRFRYRKKRQPGLLLSRIEAVGLADYDRILFLDDDAELEEGYLGRLRELYARYPEAAAIGGTDGAIRGNFLWNLFARAILYDSGDPGRLSPSGYGGSMTRWNGRREPFRTEYLLGCNMSFRTSALLGLVPVDWLGGYSLGEDLYLSYWASLSGEMWIDPGLKVRHRQSATSRDKLEQVAYTEIANHYHLLRLRQPGAWRRAALLWTASGLLARALAVRRLRPRAAGYGRAIRFVLAEDWRWFHENISNLGNGGKVRRSGEVPREAGSSDVPELRIDSGRSERRRSAPSADREV